MGNIIIYLENTTLVEFREWLTRYTDTHQGLYPSDKGNYSVSNLARWNNGRAYISATWITNEENNPEIGICSPDIEVIRFECLSVGGRLKVKIDHSSNLYLLVYVFALLEELGKDWPGTMQSISYHITGQKLNHGLEPPDKKDTAKSIDEGIPNFLKVLLIPYNFDFLNSSLVGTFRYFKPDQVIWKPEPNMPSGLAKYWIYVLLNKDLPEETEKCLGYIQLRIMPSDVTNAEIQYMGGAIHLELFEKLLAYWNNMYMVDAKISNDLKRGDSISAIDNLRPEGSNILADNTGGTVLYKRDNQGVIGDVIPNLNRGWTVDVGQKSIYLKPVDVTTSTEVKVPKLKEAKAPKSQDVRIAKRQEKVKELSEKGEPVENIARNIGVSIATVVRDRKSLGIATPRDKRKP